MIHSFFNKLPVIVLFSICFFLILEVHTLSTEVVRLKVSVHVLQEAVISSQRVDRICLKYLGFAIAAAKEQGDSGN